MRRLVWFAAGLGTAAATTIWLLPVHMALLLGLALFAAAAGLLVSLRVRAKQELWLRRTAAAALGLAVGFLWTAGYDLLFLKPIRALDGQQLTITAEIADTPQPTEYGARVYARMHIAGRPCKTLLYLKKESADLQPGDTVTMQAALCAPEDEDYELYYRSLGVQLLARQRGEPDVVYAAQTPLRYYPQIACRELKSKVRELFPADAAPFMQALLTGDRSGLSYEQTNAMSVAGISHTIAISGMHVSILLGLILLLTGRRRVLSALIGIPTVLFYTLLVGGTPSVTRAAVMQIILLLAPLLRRENDGPTSLAAAFVCMTAANPWVLQNWSFQLSFAAIAGIILFSGRIYQWFSGHEVLHRCLKQRRWYSRILRFVLSGISSTLSALIATVPLTAWNFGMVSLYAVLSNLLVLWAVTILFEAGLLTCLLGFVCTAPAKICAAGLSLLVRYVLQTAKIVMRLPFAAVYTENVFVPLWLVFVYLVLLAFCLQENKKPIELLASLLLTLCLCLMLGSLDADRSEFQMTILDVGQGQCVVFSADGVDAMIDCGGSGDDEAGETAARYFLAQGKTELDILALTHYDRDHVGGVFQLLSRLQVRRLYMPDVDDPTGLRLQIEQSAEAAGTEICYMTKDVLLQFSDVNLTIFAPVSDISDNDACLSVYCCAGTFSALVTGDMSTETEGILVDTKQIPHLTVLMAGHHGAAGSTGEFLLHRTTPQTVVVSVGENSYGHPAAATLERIAECGADVYSTKECGTITIRR